MNKTVLCIIDGLGVNFSDFGNAVAAAKMKNLERVMREFPSCVLKASGGEVGLVDEKDAGNSEIGHNAIGAGQYVKQGLALVNNAFQSGTVYKNDVWRDIVDNAKQDGKKLNVIVLLSDGRLHSDIEHLFKLLEQCKNERVKVAIHALADGRDVATQSVGKYLQMTRDKIKQVGADAKIATVAGRGVLFMDRYKSNVGMMKKSIEVCVLGKGESNGNVGDFIKRFYNDNQKATDETLRPFVLEPKWLIQNGDSVLLLNYRGDRAVQTCEMFEHGEYLPEDLWKRIDKCLFAGVMQYDAEIGLPKRFLVQPPAIKNGLTEWLCKYGVRQFSVTETVKFGHLTYFFNGNRALPVDKNLETWHEIKSDVIDFNKRPEMKANEICDAVIKAIESDNFDFIKLNFPNPDMVGHTGDFDATVSACRVVDDCLGNLIKCCEKHRVNFVVTSDHGNAEEMLYADGRPRSSHTNNLVPFVVLGFGGNVLGEAVGGMGLTNIAASLCALLGVPISEKFNPKLFGRTI